MKYNQPVIILVLHIFVANGTETIAVPQGDGSTYRLFGYKWFSSATDADITLTLARVQNPDGTTQPVSCASAYPRSQQFFFLLTSSRFNSYILHLHISLNAPNMPPKFCTSIFFNFFWDSCNTQEKWKTKVKQNFGGQTWCIMGDVLSFGVRRGTNS